MRRLLLISLFLNFFTQHVYADNNSLIKIGTGNPQLIFYQTGQKLCKKIYAKKSIPCTVTPSSGSVQNLLDLQNGKIDIALSQSDTTWLAIHGKGPFKKIGSNSTLKVLYHLSDLQLVILTKKDSSIFYFQDLKKHSINFGIQESGLRSTMEIITEAFNLSKNDFSHIASLPAPDQAKELCSGTLDAIIFIVSKKSNTIIHAMQLCPMRLVSFSEEDIKNLINLPIGYKKSIIKAGTYPNQQSDIRTVAIELQGVVKQ
jgi:hypothetical protein